MEGRRTVPDATRTVFLPGEVLCREGNERVAGRVVSQVKLTDIIKDREISET
ncbi:hypothetical protein E2C01_066112 [Portunus trituberculatus]|uniref:Uncharacterized protein n=1 Tax=Portunus trituberculatus TaxID=210409 RepID=A0A5B7HKM3_PORTR|nr:hypothetical protein [Portunus trituberculatus]